MQTNNIETAPAVSSIRSVGIICVSGARFAEIAHTRGSYSALIPANETDTVRALFALADEETAKASAAHKRAQLLRDAAWFTIAARKANA